MFKLHEIPEVCGSDLLRSGLYKATVNDHACGVRVCRVSAMPFNTDRLPRQRPWNQTEEAAFMTFSGEGEAHLRVESKNPFRKATVRPLVREVETHVEGNSVEFALPKPGQYVLELDSEHHALHIFYDPVKEYPEKASATYSFGPGLHILPGILDLKDNDSVYIDPGAVVYGSIRGINVQNIKVFGGGILDAGNQERIFWNDCVRWAAQCAVHLVGCENVEIRDIVILNSPTWVVGVFGCEKVLIDWIKIVGQWRYNTDGIDLVNSRDVIVQNCFIRSFDDSICIKGLDWAFKGYGNWQWKTGKKCENIRVSGCVAWCGWGRTLEIGIETDASEYRNILYEDCDLIHNSCVAIDIANGYGTSIHDVTYRDIRVEFQADTQPEILQVAEDQHYEFDSGAGNVCATSFWLSENQRHSETGKRKQPPVLFLSHNRHYLPQETPWGENYDILLEKIRVFAEPGVGKPEVKMMSASPKPGLRSHTIRNLTINGQKIRTLQEIEYTSEGNAEALVIE
jgi:hypothetical protein